MAARAAGRQEPQPVPESRHLSVPGLIFTAVLIVAFFVGLARLYFYLNVTLSDFLLNTWEISQEYIGTMILFFLMVCVAILMLILFALDWEGKWIRKMAKDYVSRVIVADYYTQDRNRNPDQWRFTGASQAEDYSRAAASVRPEPSELELQYQEGKLDGTFKEFYPNGNLKREIHYIGGKIRGLFRTYYENGQVEQAAFYIHGQLDGIYQSYYDTGILHQQKEYLRGKLNGVYKAFDEKGIPFFEITYVNDVQHGTDKIFDSNGVLQYLDTYDRGTRVNRKTYDDYGNLKYDQEFKEGEEDTQIKDSITRAVEREIREKEKRRKTPAKKLDS